LKSKKEQSQSSNEQEEPDSEFYAGGGKKEYNMDIFGFNFSELDSNLRYLIGFLLILGVFGVVLFALKKINDFNKKDPKKKKKKN
jgi:hypothetical protein